MNIKMWIAQVNGKTQSNLIVLLLFTYFNWIAFADIPH